MRGRKLLSGFIGAIQAAVFILAVSAVLSGPLNAFTVAGYALGFAAGVILGMYAEERLALGYSYLRIYSPASGKAIAGALRASGHAVTEFTARGKDGLLTVVNCVVARRAARARDRRKDRSERVHHDRRGTLVAARLLSPLGRATPSSCSCETTMNTKPRQPKRIIGCRVRYP